MRLNEEEFLTRIGSIVWRLGMIAVDENAKASKLRKEVLELSTELRNLVSLARPEYDIAGMVYNVLKFLSSYTPELPRTETYSIAMSEAEKDENND